MQRWVSLTKLQGVLLRSWQCRPFSTLRPAQHVQVPCASSGDITVSLHNFETSRPTDPLVIWIPPFSYRDGYEPLSLLPPRWFAKLPIAVLNYRWAGLYSTPSTDKDKDSSEHEPAVPHWPTPLHDIHFGYQWVAQNLIPPDLGRRDIYVYGSYLGASLATSLALTESHAHSPMAVRGLIAYNGIYNWTTLLPDHPIYKTKPSSRSRKKPLPDTPNDTNSPFNLLRRQASTLFHQPANLFDPFASPCLFFYTPGLNVPKGFPPSLSSSVPSDGAPPPPPPIPEPEPEPEYPPPRKSHLVFPGRKSSLRIPETLLLYDALPLSPQEIPSSNKPRARTKKKKTTSQQGGDSFYAQAGELASVMMRSVEMVELKDRMRWDSEFEGPEERAAEAERRVRMVEVEMQEGSGQDAAVGLWELNGEGERAAEEWLGERIK